MSPRNELRLLGELLDHERAEELSRHSQLLAEGGASALEDAGLAVRGLVGRDAGSGLGGRYLVSFEPRTHGRRLDAGRLGVGDVVAVHGGDTGEGAASSGLVAERSGNGLVVAFERAPSEDVYGEVTLLRLPDEVSYRRQLDGLRTLGGVRLGRIADLRDLLLDASHPPPRFDSPPTPDWLDRRLDDSQREAVLRAMAARDVALIHGPPGTGKTTALVELVRQARRRGERVLVTAASNLAVDNLLERLLAHGEPALRVGHPARVSPELREATLDFQVREDSGFQVSRRLLEEVRTHQRERRQLATRVERGRTTGRETRERRREISRLIGGLMEDVRRLERQAVERVLGRASIVAATATGSASDALRTEHFDRIVIDEATQLTVPASLLPLLRAGENAAMALAGDHHQLPPTVLSQKAVDGGLHRSLFERLVERWDREVRVALEVQYRMHEDIMALPREVFYEGRLIAHDSVAAHRLSQLPGVSPADDVPLCFIDTAGRGFEEARRDESSSYHNDGEAELAIRLVRELVDAGLPAADIGVITPYAAQARLLRSLTEDLPGLEVATVDGFQGREKEAIVVSLVRSNEEREIGFLADVRRMNVAWTRARRRLTVIGDSATLAGDDFYDAMLDYVEAKGAHRSAWEWA